MYLMITAITNIATTSICPICLSSAIFTSSAATIAASIATRANQREKQDYDNCNNPTAFFILHSFFHFLSQK